MSIQADAQRRPNRSSGTSLVFLGRFNPAIFQPAWFMRHNLIADEVETAQIDLITQPITSFTMEWLKVMVQPEKCELHATDEVPSVKALHDLAIGIFDLLPHTPVTAFGINRFSHFSMESEKAYIDLGFTLFNASPWQEVLQDPRMRTVQVEDRREAGPDAESVLTVIVQPSALFPISVFVSTNDHHVVDPDASDPIGVLARLNDVFDESIAHADQLIERVRSL